MQPNFNLSEAEQMLGLAYVADILGPHKNPNGNGNITIPPNNNSTTNPLTDDNGSTYPYPICPIWPSGWGPGIPGPEVEPWYNSIVQADPLGLPPIIADLTVGSNNVIIAYNSTIDAFAIAFAGTENLLGMFEDIAFIPVSAGPVSFPLYSSTANYITNPSYYPSQAASGQPAVIQPMMHFGFRVAVESYTVKAVPETRQDILWGLQNAAQKLGKTEIDLFITGHSLGAAMAGVFSAYIQANGIQGLTVNLKTYTFAAPKFANDALANNFDNGLTANGYCFRVVNNLDTVPQIPPTIEWLNDLNNPSMIEALIPKAAQQSAQSGLDSLTSLISSTDAQSVFGSINLASLNFNYVQVGASVPVMGQFPVMSTDQYYPSSFYPNGAPANPTALTQMQQEWWQHWPAVYYQALSALQSKTPTQVHG